MAEIVVPSQVCVIPAGLSKHEALARMIDMVAANPVVTDRDTFRRALYEREAVMSTGLGSGVAVPHVRIAEVSAHTIGIGIAPDGIDFAALDNRPVYVIVLFATPKDAKKTYLALLATVMKVLRDKDYFAALAACRTREDALAVLLGK